ncbi:MAG TPA: hypothetical protein VGR28_09695 [Candidatus Thermoplasmatota archaeon]|jgi:hypothetical protein|nr:hypothetical protein [Candidatus Thermoplasmatota archaeon]
MEAAASETAPEIIAQFVFIVLVAALMFGWSLLFPAKRTQETWDVRRAD